MSIDEFQFNLKSAKAYYYFKFLLLNQKKKYLLYKSQNNRIPRLAKKNKFIKQIIKSKNQKTQGTQIIEYNLGNEFQIFWNFLKKRLNSIVIKAKGIARAAQGVLKKPIDEALIQEILSINNEQDSKTFDYLEYQERDSDSSEFESYEYSQIFRSI